MENDILIQLPDNIAELVRRLESHSRKGIVAVPDDGSSDLTPAIHNSYRATITARSATITIPKGPLRHGSMLHELLHIQRFWIDRQPMLLSSLQSERRKLDNQLEHLVILPIQAEMGYDASPEVEIALRRRTKNLEEWSDQESMRLHAGLILATARILTNPTELLADLRQRMEELGVGEEGDGVASMLIKGIESKAQLIPELRREFPRYLAGYVIVLDVLNQTETEVVAPAVLQQSNVGRTSCRREPRQHANHGLLRTPRTFSWN